MPLLRRAYQERKLALHPRELPWLDRIQKTVEALPSSQADFISEMMGVVDTEKFIPQDYEL